MVATFAQGIVLGSFITGFDLRDGQVAGGPFLWLTPFNLTVGVCLLGGYALLSATWLVMKTDGLVQTGLPARPSPWRSWSPPAWA